MVHCACSDTVEVLWLLWRYAILVVEPRLHSTSTTVKWLYKLWLNKIRWTVFQHAKSFRHKLSFCSDIKHRTQIYEASHCHSVSLFPLSASKLFGDVIPITLTYLQWKLPVLSFPGKNFAICALMPFHVEKILKKKWRTNNSLCFLKLFKCFLFFFNTVFAHNYWTNNKCKIDIIPLNYCLCHKQACDHTNKDRPLVTHSFHQPHCQSMGTIRTIFKQKVVLVKRVCSMFCGLTREMGKLIVEIDVLLDSNVTFPRDEKPKIKLYLSPTPVSPVGGEKPKTDWYLKTWANNSK